MFIRAGAPGTPEMVHSLQDERFEILSGSLDFRIEGQERRLAAGESLLVPSSMRTPDPETEEDPERAELIRSIRCESDVREFPMESERYDLICILGVMHHLEVEDQLKLL